MSHSQAEPLRPLDADEAIWLASEALHPSIRDLVTINFAHEHEDYWTVCFQEPQVDGVMVLPSLFSLYVDKQTREVKSSRRT